LPASAPRRATAPLLQKLPAKSLPPLSRSRKMNGTPVSPVSKETDDDSFSDDFFGPSGKTPGRSAGAVNGSR
jgi:hypothetical protein